MLRNGLLIYNETGKLVHRINKPKGLQYNTVLSMKYTDYGKLWLGLFVGVDALDISTSYSYVVDQKGNTGATYAAVMNGDELYIGTNQGLFRTSEHDLSDGFDLQNFTSVENSGDQVWVLKKLGGEIFSGQNSGLYLLENNTLKQIDNKPGVWDIASFGNYLVTGNYYGIHVYEKSGGKWKYIKSLDKVYGTCNQLVFSGNKLFVNIPLEGVLELTIDSELNILSRKMYPKTLFGNTAFSVNTSGNLLQVTTLDYFFEKNIENSHIFKRRPRVLNPNLRKQMLINYTEPIRLNSTLELYRINGGFVLNDYSVKGVRPPKKLQKPEIISALSFNDKSQRQIFDGEELLYSENNLRFSFTIPNFPQALEYQYKLEGYSEDWSPWVTRENVEFLNLKGRAYTLKIRARYNSEISPVMNFKFKVRPPFYLTNLALVLYGILAISVVYFVRKYYEERLQKQKAQLLIQQEKNLEELARKHRDEMMLKNQERLKMEQEQLRKTLEQTELELAKKMMNQRDMNDSYLSIRTKLEEVQNTSENRLGKKEFGELLNFINNKIDKNINKEYEVAFDHSQAKFHETLLQEFPDLSPKDLRIASYLVMNMSSKKIAKIMNVLPSSVDVSRSRLRKKLKVEENVNLREFLNRYKS